MIDDKRLSRYLEDLPAIYREAAGGGRPDFLGRFLLAFEHVLSGVGDPARPGLEEILDGIVEDEAVQLAGAHRYFTPIPHVDDPGYAPAEFLEWLSGWVALTLRDDWKEEERRRILAEIVPAYRRRGTLDGLRQVLAAFTGGTSEDITISEGRKPFRLGVWSTVGEDTALGDRPHYFLVHALVPSATDMARTRAAIRAIIDMEKPAHTRYELFVQSSALRIGVSSTVGVNTVLGVHIEIP